MSQRTIVSLVRPEPTRRLHDLKRSLPNLQIRYVTDQPPIIKRDNLLLMVDDKRLDVKEHETIENKLVRFRTLGCYPLTGAIESSAKSVEEIILELIKSKNSEREGRAIDKDQIGSMEKKKQEGYF